MQIYLLCHRIVCVWIYFGVICVGVVCVLFVKHLESDNFINVCTNTVHSATVHTHSQRTLKHIHKHTFSTNYVLCFSELIELFFCGHVAVAVAVVAIAAVCQLDRIYKKNLLPHV